MSNSKLFHNLKVSGFLSFGPKGIDLPMEPLNVLIGPNGSGKSNFLEVFALLKAATRDISDYLAREGGISDWLWKGPGDSDSITIDVTLDYPKNNMLHHSLTLADQGGLPVVTSEKIEPLVVHSGIENEPSYYRPVEKGCHSPYVEFTNNFRPGESILAFAAIENYRALDYLNNLYRKFYVYQSWSFGPRAGLRHPYDSHGRSEFLDDGPQGPENLALVLSNIQGKDRRRFVTELQELLDDIVDITSPVTRGTVSLFLEERVGGQMPASRLSDGTLRYLCLLSILTHPKPPPFVAIDEPELGLHPDAVAQIAELLVDASRRTQLVVTTHSRMLIDALSDYPSSVVVCEKHNGESRFERLDGKRLQSWLDKFSLGDLWGSGELGGNRW
ncbi:MAG: AAA family ATPase [Gammaproteobacteria bacterium]|nr:AAA family ATPase [Gammaproteobacteria bacterium]MDE0511375.1 AAA family ATPase [Gammaproteobacteria bacterium]